MRKIAFLLLAASLVFWACTPKTTEEAQASETTPEKPAESNDPCATFSDSHAGELALDAHVIYRDYIKMNRFKQALPYWRQAFEAAPAADGQRQTHYEDGIAIYDHFLNEASSDDVKRTYLDSIFYMYDRMGECYYADDPGYIAGRKAFDMYYSYRDLVDDSEILAMFKKSLDIDGLEANAFVINPFTALLVEMFQGKRIERDEAVKYAKQVLAVCETHVDDKEEGWPTVIGYAPVRLEAFETVKGFYDCAYYREKYYDPIDLNEVDCEELFLIATRLRYGDCEVESEELKKISSEYQNRCRMGTPDTLLVKAREALEQSRYQEAIDIYLKYLENKDDPERLAQFYLRIAKIYYAHVRNFPKAREYAYKALEYRTAWGEPYMLIGKLYASSGPLCGPGRGWDSQIVTWPAIDKFQKAKSVDPSVAAEANKLIASYSRYMPSVEDIFQRQLNAGDSFRVGCWIQENTVIRPAQK